MLNRLRRLFIPVLIATIAAGGLAYAAVDDEAPSVEVVEETPDQTEPTDSEEPSDDEVTPDEGTEDDGEVSDTSDGDTGEVTPVVDTDTPEASHGPERSTEGCAEGFSGNHGKHVSSTEEHPRNDAAHSPCGKPVHEDKDHGDDVDDEGETESDDDVEGS